MISLTNAQTFFLNWNMYTEICTQKYMKYLKKRRGRDRMVVGFTTIFKYFCERSMEDLGFFT
jgi:hypothetical protein